MFAARRVVDQATGRQFFASFPVAEVRLVRSRLLSVRSFKALARLTAFVELAVQIKVAWQLVDLSSATVSTCVLIVVVSLLLNVLESRNAKHDGDDCDFFPVDVTARGLGFDVHDGSVKESCLKGWLAWGWRRGEVVNLSNALEY